MKTPRFSLAIVCLLPALALLPVSKEIIKTSHSGGLKVVLDFFMAALSPSLDQTVILNAWQGLKITIATASLSWIFSLLIGTLLGILSSDIFWKIFIGNKSIGVLVRGLLAVPRAIHEVVWGLLLLQFFGLSPWVAIIAITIPYSSLMARVIANQLDTLNNTSLIALTQCGAGGISSFITALIPPMIPVFISYSCYRLECALRGATLMGIFGMGGIGTELQLTLQSLEFRELWTSLWMLAAVIFFLEYLINFIRNIDLNLRRDKYIWPINITTIALIFAVILICLQSLGLQINNNLTLHAIDFPRLIEIKEAFNELPILNLVHSTIILTLMSAGIAIGVPPIALMLWPNKMGGTILGFIWTFLRLFPSPLIVLLILLCSTPNISVGALALGLSNLGVMGRLLKEDLNKQENSTFKAIKSLGATNQIAWLYGKLSPQSKRYLAFAAYRTDVILRETALIGVIGGVGLGWQLQESLSSFNWAQVSVITFVFITLTLIGEALSDKLSKYWISKTTDTSLRFSF
tara:strand:+ start:8177 stop:9736 length:1560 start_codon:yes stop_codon:yes gene_type:complete